MEQAFKGLRVLEAAHVWAGPIVGMLMADMGAEVIHVEKPGVGDLQRSVDVHGPGLEGENLVFLFMNRNKKGITLDITSVEGKKIFKDLVCKSDIVIENFTPGTMDNLGLGYEELSRLNPGIIMVSVSGFGQYGPYKDYHAYDLIAQAMSGCMSVTGYPDQPPVRCGAAVADYLGGMFGFCGLTTALYWREKTGQGQSVDVSLMDSMAFTLGDRMIRYAALGEPELTARLGNRYPFMPRALCFSTKDGHFTVRVTSEAEVAGLARIVGKEIECKSNGNGANSEKDWPRILQMLETLDADMQEFLVGKTNKEAMLILESAHIPCSPVLSIEEVMEDPHFEAREMLVDVEHPTIGKMKMMGIVPKLSKTPGCVEAAGPLLGQHNEEIFCDLLGYSSDEYIRLKSENIV